MKTLRILFLLTLVIAGVGINTGSVSASHTPCDLYWETGFGEDPVEYGTLTVAAGEEAAIDGLWMAFDAEFNGESVHVTLTPHEDAALLGVLGEGTYTNLEILIGSICLGEAGEVLPYREDTTGIPDGTHISDFMYTGQGANEDECELAYAHSGHYGLMEIENLHIQAEHAVVDGVVIDLTSSTDRDYHAGLNGSDLPPIVELPFNDYKLVSFNVGAICWSENGDTFEERFDRDLNNDGEAAPDYYTWTPSVR